MSFNDLGNLIGKICRRFNLKYGEEGLAYVYRREEGHYKKDLEITTDFERVCGFLGLDYAHWQSGFADLEEMFDWVISSPYFSIKPYLEEDIEGNLKKKIRQRSTLQKFRDYLKKNQIDKKYEYLENREDYLPFIHQFFPEANLFEQIQLEKEKEEIDREISAKFNGKLVMELIPTLEDKELGLFIRDFKLEYPNFEAYILQKTVEQIKKEVLGFYQQRENVKK